MKMFHVKRCVKTLIFKGFLLFIMLMFVPIGCATQHGSIPINDFVLIPGGKEVLGKKEGLTAFVFENDQTKMPFSQFVGFKYNLPTYTEVEYWVTVDGHKLKVMIYENEEMNKYFDMSVFMIRNVENEVNIRGSKANFIAVSVINDANDDCLADNSLYQNIVIKYLRDLKNEYYKS